jgi:hypothetical protein
MLTELTPVNLDLEGTMADGLFDDLTPLTIEELGVHFEELTTMAAEQPEDALVFAGISRLVQETKDRGEIRMIMQMAVTLGAMACLDSHFEDVAEQASALLIGSEDHVVEETPKHSPAKCKACQANKPCRLR